MNQKKNQVSRIIVSIMFEYRCNLREKVPVMAVLSVFNMVTGHQFLGDINPEENRQEENTHEKIVSVVSSYIQGVLLLTADLQNKLIKIKRKVIYNFRSEVYFAR